MVLVVLFFVFSFLAVGGTYLNINPYDNLIWIKAIVHFMFLIFTMMIIPFCYKKFSGKATVKNGRRVCKWNCLIVLSLYFVIDIFLMGGIYDETFQNLGANLVYTLMFYYINLKVFFNKNKLTEEAIPCESEKEHIENTQKTLELDIDKMSPQEAAKYLMAPQLNEHYSSSNDANQEEKKTFCKLCGNIVDSETKKCTGCGKQYFKGIKINKFSATVIALTVLLAISIVFNFIQIADRNDLDNNNVFLQGRVKVLQEENEDLENQLNEYEDLVSFIDDYVVFVEDDGSNQYHKYECYKFTGDYFWAYNIEAAEDYGYKKCPICH